METRWALVDGVTLELPADCTVYELRDAVQTGRRSARRSDG